MKKNKFIIIILLIIIPLIIVLFFIKNINNTEVLSRKSINIIDEVYSTDKTYKCTVFRDNGSLTVSNNIRISLTKSNKKKIYDSDIIFLGNRMENVSVKWINNNKLNISYEDNEFVDIIKQVKNISNISIEYKKINKR